MVYFYLRLLVVCAVGLMSSGCATIMLGSHASKEELRDHRIAEVVSAGIGDGGDVRLCVTGWPAERDRDEKPAAFSIFFPLSLFEGGSEGPPVLSGGDESIASYRLLPDRMGEACPEGLAGTGAIPVRRVDRQYFSGGPPASGSAAGIGPFLDESDPGALVYVLGAGDHTLSPLVIYRHTEPIFRGSRFVSITMPSETVKPNQMAYIAMPFALVADAFAVAVVASVVVVAGLLVVFVAG